MIMEQVVVRRAVAGEADNEGIRAIGIGNVLNFFFFDDERIQLGTATFTHIHLRENKAFWTNTVYHCNQR